MFNVGGGELLIIFLVALVVLGPTKLPDAARQVGKIVGEFRRMSTGFQNEFRQAMQDPVGTAVKSAEAAEPTTKPDVTKTASPLPLETETANEPTTAPDSDQIAEITAKAYGDPAVSDDGDDEQSPPETPTEPPMFGDR